LNTDRWYFRVFQSAPDLIRALLPGSGPPPTDLGLDPAAPGDSLYRFEALEIKELSHRLAAQSCRFLQKHPQLEHLEALSQQPNLDPLLNLLTLPIRPESELAASSQQILASRPDLDTVVLFMLVQRFPQLTEAEIMVIAGIPREEIRHTRAVQDWLAEGRQEGLEEGRRDEASAMTLRLLNRRCGPLTGATTAQIQALPLEKLEALADALLDFHGPADLAAWLAAHPDQPA